VSAQNEIYKHVSGFLPVPLDHLPYIKSAEMKAVDDRMLAELRAKIAIFAQQHAAHTKELHMVQEDIKVYEDRLDELDSDEVSEVTAFEVREYPSCRGRVKQFRRFSDYKQYPEMEVRSQKRHCWSASTKCEVARFHTGSYAISASARFWRGLDGIVQLFAQARYKHADLLSQVERALGKELQRSNSIQMKLDGLQASLQTWKAMEQKIQSEMSLADYKIFAKFYSHAISKAWDAATCCEWLADALKSEC
jgi:hypothetical protein